MSLITNTAFSVAVRECAHHAQVLAGTIMMMDTHDVWLELPQGTTNETPKVTRGKSSSRVMPPAEA